MTNPGGRGDHEGGGTAVRLEVRPDPREEPGEAAQRSEERFRLLADAMPHLVWIARDDGAVTYYNSRAAEYQGLEQSADGTWPWRPIVHPDDVEATAATWRSAVARGAPFECEHRIRMADGSYRWHLSRAFRAGPEGTARWFGTATDVHDLKAAKDALRESEARLLLAAEAEREVARQKDQFIAMLAHELRNPLAPIRTAVAVLRAKGSTDPDQARCQDVIERQAAHMARLLDDLLDISRVSRGKLTLRPSPVLLRDAIEAAVDVSRPLIDEAHQELIVESADGLVVHGDQARLVQVIVNLLTNAAKFTPAGGRIQVSARADGGQAEIAVRDTGAGIPRDMLDKVFELFTQGDTAADQGPGGLGIGLALARRLVDMHGGTIRAFSDGPGHGSQFVVRLPITRKSS